MNENDDTILEFLRDTDAAFPKKGLEVNLDLEGVEISYSTIKRRTGRLEDAGLIETVREKGSYYCITDRGERYLDGELEPAEIEPTR